MSLVTTLRHARGLIEDPKNWLQGNLWEERAGVDRYCMLGAIVYATRGSVTETGDEDYAHAHATLSGVLKNTGARGFLTSFNDDPSTTHADVLAVFDKAITVARDTE